ncbi:MAG: acyl-CoA dehydrogenase family protein [Promethearchaeota archaeon]
MDFSLSSKQKELQQKAREFSLKWLLPTVHKYDELGITPMHVIKEAWKAGLMNLSIPKKHGGEEVGLLEQALVVEEMAAAAPGMATTINGNSLGLEPLLMCNNNQLIAEISEDLLKNPNIICFATSEPNMGSDVAGMICKADSDGDDWILNGKKYWITNAGIAKYASVFANTDPKSRHKGICAFLVRMDKEGVETGISIEKMGHRCSNTTVIKFDNYRVPKEDVMEVPGKGFGLAMKTFSITRPIIGAMATGLARSAMEYAIHYVKKRRAFGQKLAEFQALQFKLAECYQKVETARLMTWRACWDADTGKDPLLWASMTKYYASEIAIEVASESLQCFGGYGYTKMMPIEKLFRDAKLYQIYEGTTEIQKLIISRHVLGAYEPAMPALENVPFAPIDEDFDDELESFNDIKKSKNAKKTWRCRICGHIHYGDKPPEECPVCKFPKEVFNEVWTR